jgi:hypothetical protein
MATNMIDAALSIGDEREDNKKGAFKNILLL